MEKIDYLIYGSSGFIGKYLYNYLEANFSVTTIGRDGSCDINVLDPNLKMNRIEVNTLIHVAGIAHVKKHATGYDDKLIQEDLAITTSLIDKLDNIALDRIIYFSSVSVYGKDIGVSIDVNSKLIGNTGYRKCKIETENMLIIWCAKNKVDLLIYRLPLVVGESAKGNLAFASRLINKGFRFFPKKGGLKSYATMNYIGDKILSNSNKSGIFNLIEGDLHFTDLVLKFCNTSEKTIYLVNDKIYSLLFLPIRLINKKIYTKIFSDLTFNNN
jgi:nucleoside-diphosphate-sugar epimerase